MDENIRQKQSLEKARCVNDIMRICRVTQGVESSHERALAGKWLDHAYNFKSYSRQYFIFDNPYVASNQVDQEQALISRGWRVVHLPRDMSIHVAYACQPRLIAHHNSRIDLIHLANLLSLANFQGNKTLSSNFCADEIYL